MNPQVIGISGNSGAGKTTLAQALARDLNMTVLCWDDFDEISQAPEDYVAWYQTSRDYSAWNYSELADVLQALKAHQAIPHPVFNTILQPTDFIIFEAPLGRLHQQTGQYLDVVLHLDVSLDVSLGWRLLRDFQASEKTKEDLLEDIDYYLRYSRPLFLDDDLKKSADVLVDGMMSTESQIQFIKERIIK